MSAHTPGPWLREGLTVYALQRAGRWEENRFWVRVQGKAPPEELEANARLVAAAPELLAALEAVLAWRDATIMQRVVPGRNEVEDNEVEDVLAARAAIAKARGES